MRNIKSAAFQTLSFPFFFLVWKLLKLLRTDILLLDLDSRAELLCQ